MPKRSRKPPEDENEVAFGVMAAATGSAFRQKPEAQPKKKNPAAVALGRLGGVKGGPARAKKLSKKRRGEIARLAAAARWEKHEKT